MQRSQSNTFFKGLSTQTLVTLVLGILEFFQFAIFSRLLSKADFGYFAALSALLAICTSVSEAGLGSAIVQRKNPSDRYISTAFFMSLSIGVIFSLLICILSPFISRAISDESLTMPLMIMSVTLLLNSLISVGNALLLRNLHFGKIGFIRCFSFLLASIVGIVMAYNGFGLMSIITYATLYPLFMVVIIYTFFVKIPSFSFYRDSSKDIFSFGGWLTLGVIVNNITQQLDKLLLSKLLSVEALGAYTRPATFTTTTSSKITGMFDTVLFPMLSGIQDDIEKVKNVLYRSIGLLNSISILMASIFFFNAELIITIFFGTEWLDMVPIMRIISIALIFSVDGQLVDCFFRSMNFVKTGFYLRVVGMCITITGLYVGAHFGLYGVAVSYTTSLIIMVLLKVSVLTKKLDANFITIIKYWIKAWRPLVLIGVVGSIYFLFNHNILVNIMFAFVFSIVVLIQYVVFPKLVSQEYYNTMGPQITKVIKKVTNK